MGWAGLGLDRPEGPHDFMALSECPSQHPPPPSGSFRLSSTPLRMSPLPVTTSGQSQS